MSVNSVFNRQLVTAVTHISASTDFMDKVEEAIIEMQEEGRLVDVQYSSCVMTGGTMTYSALIIGRGGNQEDDE